MFDQLDRVVSGVIPKRVQLLLYRAIQRRHGKTSPSVETVRIEF